MSSFIIIYDHSQREAQIHLWSFIASLMIIFDPKKKVIDDKKNFCLIYDHSPARSAKPFMNIYGFIDDHFWLKKSAKRKKTKTIYIIFDKKTHSSQEFMSNFKSRTKRLPRIQVTVSHNQRLRIPSMQIPQ